jgi:3-deoxy-D-manno-octulosonic acid kinase
VLTQLPHGYAQRRLAGGVHVVARGDVLAFVADAVQQAGSLYQYALQQGSGRLEGGRGPVPLLELPTGETVAVRHCWRGGAVARVLRDRHLRTGQARPVAELEVQSILSARGVATPQVVAAVTYERGWWYRGDVASALVPEAVDLARLSLGAGRWSEEERVRAWFSAGELLRAFFATGAVHADLNLRNIIVRRDTGEAFLLDLDRCQQGERPKAAEAFRMTARFHRSRRKLERLLGGEVGSRELAALKRGRGT